MLCISKCEFGVADTASAGSSQFPEDAAILFTPDKDVIP
jgi:hypothetical protein